MSERAPSGIHLVPQKTLANVLGSQEFIPAHIQNAVFQSVQEVKVTASCGADVIRALRIIDPGTKLEPQIGAFPPDFDLVRGERHA